MRIALCVLLLNLLTTFSFAQEKISVSGTVKDNSNNPVPGVSIIVKGTSKGVSSDTEGNFTMENVPSSAMLVFTAIGYAPFEAKASSDPLNIILKQQVQTAGDEVVVTALNIKKEKRALGYAVSEIKGDEMSRVQVANPVNALMGKAPGVQISTGAGGTFGGTKIQIRGASTLRTNNQPIFVIDGIILDNDVSGGDQYGNTDWGNDLKNLNPDDFESVSILKGAAASALYGSRAMNGVVMITTKKGTVKKGIGIEFGQDYTLRRVQAPKLQNVFGAGDPVGPSGWNSRNNTFDATQFDVNSLGEAVMTGDGAMSWGPRMQGQKVRDFRNDWTTFDPQPHNFTDMFKTGQASNTNVALSGGNEKTTFRTGFSYYDEKGVVPNNDFKRTAFSLRATHELAKFLKADIGANYTSSRAQNPASQNFAQGLIYDVLSRSYASNYWKTRYMSPNGGLPDAERGDLNAANPGNKFFFNLYENFYTKKDQAFRGNAKLIATLSPNWSVIAEANINNVYTNNEDKQLGTGVGFEGSDNEKGGMYAFGNAAKLQSTIKGIVSYSKSFKDLDVNASFGGERFNTARNYNYVQTSGGLIAPGVFNLANSKGVLVGQGDKPAGGTNATKKINSLYFYADLAYKRMLYVNITARNDWSSALTFADGTGNNSYFYPSASLGWVFTETFKLPSQISYGKFRLSAAAVGNDTDPFGINWGYQWVGGLTQASGARLPYYSYSNDNNISNKNIRSELKKSYEGGLEMKFLNNRLGFDITVYQENTTRQIIPLKVPVSSGINSYIVNNGNIENKGIEIAITTVPYKTKDWKVGVDLNFAHNKTMVKSLIPGVVNEMQLDGQYDYGDRVGVFAYAGQPYGQIVSDAGYKRYQAYDAAGKPIDNANNGQKVINWRTDRQASIYVREGKARILGNLQPKWTGSLMPAVSYKNLSLYAMIEAKVGGQTYSRSYRYMSSNGLSKSTLQARDKEYGGITWTSKEDGITYNDGVILDGVFDNGTKIDGVDVSGMTYKDAYAKGLVEPTHSSYFQERNGSWSSGVIEPWVITNSYVALRELTVSYAFPDRIAKKVAMKGLQVLFTGRDLALLYNSMPDGLNPLMSISNRSAAAYDFGYYPMIKSFTLALKARF